MILRHSSQRLVRPTCNATPRLFRRTLAQSDRWPIITSLERSESQIVAKPKLVPSTLDAQVLKEIRSRDPTNIVPLNVLFNQYSTNARSVLRASLAHEPTAPPRRRVSFDQSDSSGIMLMAHAVDIGFEHKVTFCSAFAIETDHAHNSSVIVSCAHTLEEIHRSLLVNHVKTASQSGTIAFGRRNQGSVVEAEPVQNVLTSLPRSDLVIYSTAQTLSHTLPISPYPARPGTRVRVHLVSEARPTDHDGWSPWIHGTWSKWVQGEVLGYRDFAGREAEPGTYDSLNHILFSPPPTAGSSGGPIVDEETGCVVGLMLGSRMDNRIEGVRGWGVPSEAIYEMFRLPGLSHIP